MTMVFRNGLRLTCCLGSLVCAPISSATNLLVQASLDLGGETLATAVYEDGEDSDVKAGQLVQLGGGIVQPFNERWEFQATVSWKFDSADAENGSISFQRFPVEVLAFFRKDALRVGGGPTVHLSPTLEGEGTASALGTYNFDDAVGLITQVDYFFQPTLSLGLRATYIEYESETEPVSVHGNSIGIVLSGRTD